MNTVIDTPTTRLAPAPKIVIAPPVLVVVLLVLARAAPTLEVTLTLGR